MVGEKLETVSEFSLFQKPVIKVRYDDERDRVVAGGLDSMLKFMQPTEEEGTHGLKVVHKIKLPSEVFSLDVSKCGNHFGLGLNDQHRRSLSQRQRRSRALERGLDFGNGQGLLE